MQGTLFRKFQVAIIGSSAEKKEEMDVAFQVGRFIGSQGWTLITGGRTGVMEAASRGALEAGGLTVGILPYEELDRGNKFLTVAIPTGIGYARNSITGVAGDIIVVIGGSSGTLSEVCFAWQGGKTILACEWLHGVSRYVAGKTLDDRREDSVVACKNADELMEKMSFYHEVFTRKD